VFRTCDRPGETPRPHRPTPPSTASRCCCGYAPDYPGEKAEPPRKIRTGLIVSWPASKEAKRSGPHECDARLFSGLRIHGSYRCQNRPTVQDLLPSEQGLVLKFAAKAIFRRIQAPSTVLTPGRRSASLVSMESTRHGPGHLGAAIVQEAGT
jgi:hypothetical protein